MATERFSFTGAASTSHYLAIFNSAGQVFDWLDSTFKALASATTKATVGTEQTDLGGTSKSAYIKDVDLSLINSTSTPAKFRCDWYTDSTAATRVSETEQFTVVSSSLSDSTSISLGSSGSDITGTPGPTSTYAEKLDWLFAKEAFEQTQSKTLQTVSDSSGTVISEAPVSSDGTTVTREEFTDA